ncbi:MAG TPA: 50S ribosomal L9 C-terminal domain-containing protein, partial [Actinotalea sp.]
DKRKVEIGQPIKAIGEYQVKVRLHDDLSAQIDVRVVPGA